MITLSSVLEDTSEKLSVVDIGHLRDGGSQPIEFSDGFKCMYDNGIGSKARHKFVKSWQDRTEIDVPEKYKKVLRNDKRFSYKDLI